MDNITEINDFNYLIRGRHGLFLANRNDFYLRYALIRYGECCEIEKQFLCSLVQPGGIVVEVGANIGVHTIPLAQTVGPNGKVIAIEAQPTILHYLSANIVLNGLFNVATYGYGCGATSKTMSFPTINYSAPHRQNFGGVSLMEHSESGVTVKVVALDDLVSDSPKVNLLKIDVEGMESEVLKGAAHTIVHHRPRIYLENDRLEKSQALIEQLVAMDYRLWWHIPRLFNPNNYFGVQENEFGKVSSFNMLCLPREEPTQVTGLVEVTDSSFHPLRRVAEI